MDQLQCFVTHVDNVDQDGDLLLGKAYKLQAYLHQNIGMAQSQGGSTIFPNLHELHSKFLKDKFVFATARENVEMVSIEFLFLDAQCMSKVVGVGLHQSLVTVTNANDVKVETLNESAWESSLASTFMKFPNLGAFELISFKMPKMEMDNFQSMSLSTEQVAKQFGVCLKNFHGDNFIMVNEKEQNNMFFPLIWKVA
jgi:hypothetical protein